MTYEPQLGDYGCVQTNGLIGFLIQLGTVTKYNHAFIYIGDGKIIEATPKRGVIISPVTNYKNIAWNQHEPKTDEQRKALVNEALKYAGRKYSFLSFLIDGLEILHIRVPKRLKDRASSADHVDCSGMVTRVYRACGFTVDSMLQAFAVKPSDLIYRLLYI